MAKVAQDRSGDRVTVYQGLTEEIEIESKYDVIFNSYSRA